MNRTALAEFVRWVQTALAGDEKGQAQIFLDRLFQAFGQPGCLDVGGAAEFRIRKAAADGGGTAFADYVWKPVVLIEMKKRGADLRKHYRQAFDYWTRLVPNRPRYVILCNFDEFQVYDFETQMDAPVDTVALPDLPDRFGALAFLAPGNPNPTFGNDRVAVTRQAADQLAACFTHLVQRGVERELAQRFVLQILVALFAEDIGLLEKYFVTRLLADCAKAEDSYDLLGGLFGAMNSVRPALGGRYKGVPYFNGGLFAKPAAIELDIVELNHLREAANSDWSKVQPEIFGTLFQHSMESGERHAFGAHFTHPADIMKIVGPTIVEPWREQIEGAKTLTRLRELLDRLQRFRVLDPACGSGNFLYIAYRELKRLEARLFERMEEFKSEAQPGQGRLSFLSAQNFYGLDILPFAVEIAKVTMMIARKLAIDEVHITERALPLDNLDANFLAVDALLLDPGGFPAPWPKVDVIIGNPPFLGAKLLKPQRGPDYVNRLRAAYPEVPGMADYCVYWLRRAHDHLPPCTKDDPVTGRAGLVGTQNIRNNQSRVGGLDTIVKDGTILEAVENQPWSGEANVHVSIVNWVKTQDSSMLPTTRKLWFKVENGKQASRLSSAAGSQASRLSSGDNRDGCLPLPVRRKRGEGSASKQYQLDVRECTHINSALSDETDVSGALELRCNTKPQLSFNGQMLGHEGFLLTKHERDELIRKDPRSAEIIFPYLNGREFLSGTGTPERYVLDFGTRDLIEASTLDAAFAWVRDRVLPDRERKALEGTDEEGNVRPHHKQFLARWWQLSFGRPELIGRITAIPRYLVCSLVTKRQVFVFVNSKIRPSNLLQVFALADDYSFGVVSSSVHWEWFIRKCSKLKSDYRFGETVWNTFSWPQFKFVVPPSGGPALDTAALARIEAVAAAGCELRRIRAEALPKIKGGLRALYRTLELPGKNPLKDAHASLDAAVLAAYGFDPSADLLAQLLALNLDVAGRLDRNEPVTAPGLPPGFPDPARLITPDCIQPPSL